MWLDYAIGFGGVALVGAAAYIIHALMLRKLIAEKEAERRKADQPGA